MAAVEFVNKRYGRKTQRFFNPETASIATTVTRVLKNNPDRIEWLIINLSTNDAFLAWDNQVSSTRGVKLAAGGGSVTLNVEEDGELVADEVLGIASVGAASIFTVEVVAR